MSKLRNFSKLWLFLPMSDVKPVSYVPNEEERRSTRRMADIIANIMDKSHGAMFSRSPRNRRGFLKGTEEEPSRKLSSSPFSDSVSTAV